MIRCAALTLLLLATGCDALPQDAGSTFDRIEASHRMTIGVVAGMPLSRTDRAARLIQALERETGARATIVRGAGEPMLVALRDGKLDLVIAPIAADSPWAMEVAFGPPLAITGAGDARLDLVAAVRNGENRWVMLVERNSRAIAPDTASR